MARLSMSLCLLGLLSSCKPTVVTPLITEIPKSFGNNQARQYVLLAGWYEENGQVEDCMSSFDKAVQYDAHPSIYKLWGEVAYKHRQFDIAKKAWNRYIQSPPNDQNILQQLERL